MPGLSKRCKDRHPMDTDFQLRSWSYLSRGSSEWGSAEARCSCLVHYQVCIWSGLVLLLAIHADERDHPLLPHPQSMCNSQVMDIPAAFCSIFLLFLYWVVQLSKRWFGMQFSNLLVWSISVVNIEPVWERRHKLVSIFVTYKISVIYNNTQANT